MGKAIHRELAQGLRALAKQRRLVAKLESQVAVARQAELASLPAKYGFSTAREFIRTVRSAYRWRANIPKSRRQPRVKVKVEGPAQKLHGLTWLTKKETETCIADIQDGVNNQTIVAKYHISPGAVYQFKKKHGLT